MAPNTSSASPSTPPPFGAALLYWLKLGFINFGGPAGQIAMMTTSCSIVASR